VVHRVLRRLPGPNGYTFLVQGDQVEQPDGRIPQAQVYGRVAAIERPGIHINMQRPVMRILAWLAVLRSRWHFGRARGVRFARQLAKRLSVLL
jgi:hypothetical protein